MPHLTAPLAGAPDTTEVDRLMQELTDKAREHENLLEAIVAELRLNLGFRLQATKSAAAHDTAAYVEALAETTASARALLVLSVRLDQALCERGDLQSALTAATDAIIASHIGARG